MKRNQKILPVTYTYSLQKINTTHEKANVSLSGTACVQSYELLIFRASEANLQRADWSLAGANPAFRTACACQGFLLTQFS